LLWWAFLRQVLRTICPEVISASWVASIIGELLMLNYFAQAGFKLLAHSTISEPLFLLQNNYLWWNWCQMGFKVSSHRKHFSRPCS
jgi:hypothetical protein